MITTQNLNGTTIGRWHSARKAMEVDRIVTRALRAGTTGMRAARDMFLPPDHRERTATKEYRDRLLRTVLFPAYDDAIGGIVDKPFQRQIELKEADTLPPNLQALEGDCDREGTPLTEMGRMLLDSMADTGLAFLLVDKPGSTDSTGRALTLADEEASDIRPYFVCAHPDNVIDWSWRWSPSGKRILQHVAIYQEDVRADIDTGTEKVVQRVRVWTETDWSIWEREAPASSAPIVGGELATDLLQTAKQAGLVSQGSTDKGYTLVADGTHPLGKVPLVWRNIGRKRLSDPLVSNPPLIDLAWKNIEDWQCTSILSNSLHWHGYPMFAVSGADADLVDGTNRIIYGAGATLISRDPGMRAEFLESSGAIEGRMMERLAAIRADEQSLGLAPFLEQVTAGSTATAVDASGARAQSRVQSWTELLEWMIYDSFKVAQLWETSGSSDELPEGFDVDIFRDFGIPTRAATDLQTLLAMRAARDISQETLLREVKKRGTIGDEVDIEAEVSETGTEREESMAAFSVLPGGAVDAPQMDDEGNPAEAVPAKDAPVGPSGMPTEKAADTALNGAQVQAAAEIVQQVARRELPRESGVAQLVEFFNLDPARADRLMGAVGKTFFIEAPEPAPQQAPAPAKKEQPA